MLNNNVCWKVSDVRNLKKKNEEKKKLVRAEAEVQRLNEDWIVRINADHNYYWPT